MNRIKQLKVKYFSIKSRKLERSIVLKNGIFRVSSYLKILRHELEDKKYISNSINELIIRNNKFAQEKYNKLFKEQLKYKSLDCEVRINQTSDDFTSDLFSIVVDSRFKLN